MYYVYVLQSLKDRKLYTGYTEDLKRRLKQHNDGKIVSTKLRKPFRVVYYEACSSEDDALHREKYLKTAYGKRFLKSRLKHYFAKHHV